MTDNLIVTFWGVRGSRPVPGSAVLRYGGNTACVEVVSGGTRVILDAGTGICNLGGQLLRQPEQAHILIGHTHWDHIQGFPFFAPVYVRGNRFTLYGEVKQGIGFSRQMHDLMSDPHFPIQLDKAAAELTFKEVTAGDAWSLPGGLRVHAARNCHPNGALAYRIDNGAHSVCYITDTEHQAQIDQQILEFARSADLLIYDAQYTETEYAAGRQGWGHSTWQAGVRLAEAAGAAQLVLFHHEPERDDLAMDELERSAQLAFPACFAAREGMVIKL